MLGRLGNDPNNAAYVKPAAGDVWDFGGIEMDINDTKAEAGPEIKVTILCRSKPAKVMLVSLPIAMQSPAAIMGYR
jgi:hypothetical protein